MATLSDSGFAKRLVAELAPRASVDAATGQVTFSAGGLFEELKCLLRDLLQTDGQIPAEDAARIATDALFAAARSPGLTVDRFLKEATRRERDYLREPPQRYVLLTQVSIDGKIELPRSILEGVTISFPLGLPVPFSKARGRAAEEAATSLYADPPTRYRWVRASVTAKSVLAAGDKALDALQFLVALWNLGLNRGTGVRFSGGRRKPVNHIGLAPIHTLHRPSGARATDLWWYEPTYVLPLEVVSRNVPGAVVFGKRVVARMRRLPYARQLKDCIRYYGRALGEADWGTSYILLWQALESVTGTSKMKYETTIRRAAFLFDDVEYHTHVLGNLKQCRNALVHAQIDPVSLETRLYMLKRYVEVALLFHVGKAGVFESFDEACQFLDFPSSTKALGRRLALLKKAAKFRGV